MKLAMTFVGLVVAVLVTSVLGRSARASGPPVAQRESIGWDAGGAARYLDAQMDAWFANGKKLQTGHTETVCISCHTTLPYAFARPTLRRALGAGDRTPQ